MIVVLRTAAFIEFTNDLRDVVASAKIATRIDRLAKGNPGDHKAVGEGVFEMRIDHGPGYRVYYCKHGTTTVVLLCGGDKKTQKDDIIIAKKLARDLEF
jgi:putative addiction module killer protein